MAPSGESEVNVTDEFSSPLPVLDVELLLDLLESLVDPNAIAALYRKFSANAAVFIRDLRVQDTNARLDTLHTLKGSAAMMGAKRFTALASWLQEQLQRSSIRIETALEALEAELRALRAEAGSELARRGATLEL